jgi:flagellar basal body-associated protein FliL
MILIILSVLVMVCTPVVTIFAMRQMISSNVSTAADKKDDNKSGDKFAECQIKNQQCIIGNTKGTRYVKLDVTIRYTEPDSMKDYFDEKGAENGNNKSIYNRIKAEITKIIMGKQLDEIDSPAGLKNLSEELKEAIKSLLPKGAKGTITEVYFPNFLIS